MGRFKDLTGQRFGRLVVIKRAEDYVEPSGRHRSKWLCKCDCGNEVVVMGNNLNRQNGTRSCGCLRQDFAYNLNKSVNTYDLSGEYGIGYTSKGEEFWFDLEDYNLIKDYCWYINNKKYVCAKLNNKQILLHRVVMHFNGSDEIDHIHGKDTRFDNRKYNLRIATRNQNAMNVGLKSNNTSGVTGVHYDKRKQKWIARITIDGKRVVIGEYDNLEHAKEKRLMAEKEHYREFCFNYSQNYI